MNASLNKVLLCIFLNVCSATQLPLLSYFISVVYPYWYILFTLLCPSVYIIYSVARYF